jgi:hypothetical protein
MSEVIHLSEDELNLRISEYETKWADFADTYAEPTCCAGCMVRYDKWGLEQCNDWNDYTGLRWLRGDEITYEEDEDD